MKQLVFATNNKNKLKEIRHLLEGSDWQVLSLKDIGITHEVIEDADSFEGNALKKASEIMNLCHHVTLADDSGIMVEVLGGRPGIYSARFALDDVKDGEQIDEANNDKMLSLMAREDSRKAKYVCALAIVHPSGETAVITEECHGEIAFEKSGSGGFGYDCLFYLPEYGCTMASISAEEKNRISHRAKAMRKMVAFLNNEKTLV